MTTLINDEPALRSILNTCRLSVRATNKVIGEEGIDTLEELCALTSKELDDVINTINKTYRTAAVAQRCNIGGAIAKRMKAVRLWAKDSIIEGGNEMPSDANTIASLDADWLEEITILYNDDGITKKDKDTSENVVRIAYDGTNWYDARRSIIDLAGAKIGAKGIPISYLLRSTRGDWNDPYETIEQKRIATYRHSGPGFQDDNKMLYQILVQYFGSTTCNDVVRRYEKSKNGISAWKVVIAQLEGAGYQRELVQQAKTKLSSAKFTGNA